MLPLLKSGLACRARVPARAHPNRPATPSKPVVADLAMLARQRPHGVPETSLRVLDGRACGTKRDPDDWTHVPASRCRRLEYSLSSELGSLLIESIFQKRR
jgi:hypothetical protein